MIAAAMAIAVGLGIVRNILDAISRDFGLDGGAANAGRGGGTTLARAVAP